MVVRKTKVDVSRAVICMWRVVCGERGRGMESCWGWRVGATDGAAAVGSGFVCARDGTSEDAGTMRGMSDVRCYLLESSNYFGKAPLTPFCEGVSSGTISPTALAL